MYFTILTRLKKKSHTMIWTYALKTSDISIPIHDLKKKTTPQQTGNKRKFPQSDEKSTQKTYS